MKRLLLLLAISYGASGAEIWSCQTNCNITGDTYNDGAWRPALPKPTYIAATSGTNRATMQDGVLTCRNFWNTSGAIKWRLPVNIAPDHCVSVKDLGVESVWPASRVWPTAPDTPSIPKLLTLFTIEPSPSFNGDPITVTWETIAGVISCRASWQSAEDRELWNLPLNGTKQLIQEFAGSYSEKIECKHPLVSGGFLHGYRVLSRGFDCAPANLAAVERHVTWELLPLSAMSPEYQGMAIWQCQTPQGIRKQKMLFNVKNVATGSQEIIEGVNTIEAKLRDCMLNCQTILPAAQRDLLEQFALRAVMKEPM
jgi:hypothetical protein